jgi:hypothetical protein
MFREVMPYIWLKFTDVLTLVERHMFREVMLDIWLKFTDVLEESTDLVFKHFA